MQRSAEGFLFLLLQLQLQLSARFLMCYLFIRNLKSNVKQTDIACKSNSCLRDGRTDYYTNLPRRGWGGLCTFKCGKLLWSPIHTLALPQFPRFILVIFGVSHFSDFLIQSFLFISRQNNIYIYSQL